MTCLKTHLDFIYYKTLSCAYWQLCSLATVKKGPPRLYAHTCDMSHMRLLALLGAHIAHRTSHSSQLTSHIAHRTAHSSCLTSHVSCLTSRLTCRISHLTSPISHLVSLISLISQFSFLIPHMSHVSYLVFHFSSDISIPSPSRGSRSSAPTQAGTRFRAFSDCLRSTSPQSARGRPCGHAADATLSLACAALYL